MPGEEPNPSTARDLLVTVHRRHLRLWWVPVVLALLLICWMLLSYAVTRPEPIPPEARELAAQGQPIADALYRFKQEVGLWPEGLEDLVPQYLEGVPSGWQYRRANRWSGWTLQHYDHGLVWLTNDRSHWAVGLGRAMRIMQDRPAPALHVSVDPAILTERVFAELERRIERNPADIWHWQGKISLLMKLGRSDEALAACEQSYAHLPAHWWPRYARARALIDRGDGEQEVVDFAAWADAHPRFAHYWYLSLLRRQLGDVSGAIAALDQMAGLPFERCDDDTYTRDSIVADAIEYARREGALDTVKRLCDRWQGPDCPRLSPCSTPKQLLDYLVEYE